MKNTIVSIYALCMTVFSFAQNIVGAEYYWDNDPGMGNGNGLSIGSPSDEINESFVISTEGLLEGNHRLCVRTLNDEGDWSSIITKVVHVHKFNESECFWDEDPGPGNGTTLFLNTTETDVTNNYTISTLGIKEGHHILYTRSKGIGNTWGLAKATPLFIENKVVAAEYYWNEDPGVGNGAAMEIGTPNSDITFTDDVSTEGLDTTIDVHYLVVRTMGQNGAWSVALDTALFLGPVGVQEMIVNRTHSIVYPNPVRDIATVSVFSFVPRNIRVQLENATGSLVQQVFQGNVAGRREDIPLDVTTLSAGVYFICITDGVDSWTHQIVVP
jgi:hypothetical protein